MCFTDRWRRRVIGILCAWENTLYNVRLSIIIFRQAKRYCDPEKLRPKTCMYIYIYIFTQYTAMFNIISRVFIRDRARRGIVFGRVRVVQCTKTCAWPKLRIRMSFDVPRAYAFVYVYIYDNDWAVIIDASSSITRRTTVDSRPRLDSGVHRSVVDSSDVCDSYREVCCRPDDVIQNGYT